jgi:hypothetical protein
MLFWIWNKMTVVDTIWRYYIWEWRTRRKAESGDEKQKKANREKCLLDAICFFKADPIPDNRAKLKCFFFLEGWCG